MATVEATATRYLADNDLQWLELADFSKTMLRLLASNGKTG